MLFGKSPEEKLYKMKEASRVLNELNGKCHGAFRVVEHNGAALLPLCE